MEVDYLIVMMLRMVQSSSHRRFDTTRGYEREVSNREVALFLALLVLPFALLVVPILASS